MLRTARRRPNSQPRRPRYDAEGRLPGFYTNWGEAEGSRCANDVAKEIIKLKKEGIEGLVMLRITIDREGGVVSSEIVQSADDGLDAAAENAVKKAAPFPKAPEQLLGNQFPILIPVVFKK